MMSSLLMLVSYKGLVVDKYGNVCLCVSLSLIALNEMGESFLVCGVQILM